jgi:hypothetical protein
MATIVHDCVILAAALRKYLPQFGLVTLVSGEDTQVDVVESFDPLSRPEVRALGIVLHHVQIEFTPLRVLEDVIPHAHARPGIALIASESNFKHLDLFPSAGEELLGERRDVAMVGEVVYSERAPHAFRARQDVRKPRME